MKVSAQAKIVMDAYDSLPRTMRDMLKERFIHPLDLVFLSAKIGMSRRAESNQLDLF